MFKYTFEQASGLLIIISLLLIESIDANIINIAIPQMAIELHSNIFIMKLAVTSYIVGLSIFIPISAWIANKFGIKNTLIFSILVFVFSSIGCWSSAKILSLTIYRFIQGASGAFIFPVSRLLMLKIFKKEDIVKVYTIITVPVLVGPILAPVIGALLISWKSWHYIFIVNIPFGLLILIATFVWIDNYKEEQVRFNITKFILLSIFIGSISAYLDVCLISYFSFNLKVWLLSISIFFGCLYIWQEKFSLNPVLRYAVFNIKTFRICFISTLIVRLALGARAFMLSIFLQTSLHLSPFRASILFIYMTAGFFIARPFIGKTLIKFGFKKTLTIMNIGSSVSLFMLCAVHSIGFYLNLCLFLNGFFASAQFVMLNTLYYSDVEKKDYGMAVSIATMWQQLATAMGVVFVSNVIYIFEHLSYVSSIYQFQLTFFILAIVNIITQLLVHKLSETDGDSLICRP